MPVAKNISAADLPADFKSLTLMHLPRPIHDDVAYKYEEQTEKIGKDLGPLDILRHLMAEHEMNASDLGRLLNERSLGPKILNGTRELSKAHIRKLAQHFGVPADLFL